MRTKHTLLRCAILAVLFGGSLGCGDRVSEDEAARAVLAPMPTAEELARQLQRTSERARVDAAAALEGLGSDAGKVLTAVLRAARDPSEEVRLHVVRIALGVGRKDPRTVYVLIHLQRDVSTRVAEAARRGLEELQPSKEHARRVTIPAQYKTVVERVLVRPEQRKTIPVPAEFATKRGKQVLVKPATTLVEVIPPVYEEVERKVLVRPASERWEWVPKPPKRGQVDRSNLGEAGGGFGDLGLDFDWGPAGS